MFKLTLCFRNTVILPFLSCLFVLYFFCSTSIQAQLPPLHVECSPQIMKMLRAQIPTIGNSGETEVAGCSLDFSKEKMGGTVVTRWHGKQRACTRKPWPASGDWCVDTYNFWTTLTARFDIVAGCQIQNLNIQKSNTSATGIPYEEAVADATKNLFDFLQGAQRLQTILNDAIQRNPTIKQYC